MTQNSTLSPNTRIPYIESLLPPKKQRTQGTQKYNSHLQPKTSPHFWCWVSPYEGHNHRDCSWLYLIGFSYEYKCDRKFFFRAKLSHLLLGSIHFYFQQILAFFCAKSQSTIHLSSYNVFKESGTLFHHNYL